jgi:transcriptional regulator GlxA family with amidase domain
MSATTTRIGILLFSQFDLIDAGGPYEVFLTASRLVERDGGEPIYDVVLLSPDGADAAAYGGMTVTNLTAVADVGHLDVVVIPGLISLDEARNDSAIMDAVRTLAAQSDLTTSVCTGAFLLNDAGLLDGQLATTHWEDVPLLEIQGRISAGVMNARWVDNGNVITSGGLTSGIHMALHVVARLHGVELATRTARQLDLPWSPEGVRD